MKLLIVGGVAGGASAAARARRISEDAQIILFERGSEVSFANCGMPYHIGNVIPDREDLLVSTPEALRERLRIDVRILSEVEAIDRQNQTLRVRDRSSGRVYDEGYDKLILAPGAAPIRPPIPGANLPEVFTLRHLADASRIKAHVEAAAGKGWAASGGAPSGRAVIVGAGFIGVELAENFAHRGIATTILDMSPQILAPFDAEMTTPIAQAMAAQGIEIRLGESVESFAPGPDGLIVKFTKGEQRAASFAVLGIGVRPENTLAVQAGLEVGPRGGIRVNDSLQTSDPAIFAVGDAIETVDFGTGDRVQVPLAGPANRQGRIAADNALGRPSKFRGTQATAILGFFNHIAAITGLSEKALKRAGKAYRKIYIHPNHHASYYPGAESMTLKVLFDPETGQLLGAQGVGGAGVDKRIDVLAVAIQAGMTVYDLEEAELGYAPQFGSAKDPVNMAGFVAAGLLRGDHPQTDWETAQKAEARAFLLDVRTAEEFAAGHIPGAKNLPVDALRDRLSELPRDRPIIAYCQVGQRGYLATRILLQAGFSASNLSGGYKTYRLFQP